MEHQMINKLTTMQPGRKENLQRWLYRHKYVSTYQSFYILLMPAIYLFILISFI